jgi:hypothetical protein
MMMTDQDFAEFLDDRIDDWHTGRSILSSLHDYLRMTWEEYGEWVATGRLPYGMKARWGFS